jgi:hypothetical protein
MLIYSVPFQAHSSHFNSRILFLFQPGNRLSMLLLKMLFPNEETRDKRKRPDTGIQNPHVAHTPRKRLFHRHLMRWVYDGADEHHICSSIFSGELLHQLNWEACGLEEWSAQLHAVLEDDTADHDGETSADAADEGKGAGGGGGVVLADHGLNGDEWGFEEEAGTDAFNDFEADDCGKGGCGVEVDEQAVAEGYHGGAEIDAFEVAAGAVDDEAD